jgi:hypothetical protein
LDELAIVAESFAAPTSRADAERTGAAMRVVVQTSAAREPTAEERRAIDTIAAAALDYARRT